MSANEAWERRLKLLAYLMRRGFAQTAEAARYVGEDKRKVRADLEALAEHGVPLRAHPEDPRDPGRTWELAASWRAAGVEVTLFERLALLLGREVLEPLLGRGELATAMTTLDHELASTARGVEASDDELRRRFVLVQEPRKDYGRRGHLVSALAAAIGYGYRVTLSYRRPNAKAARELVRTRPLTLAIHRRGLYLFVLQDGRAGESERILTLALDRIEGLTPHPEDAFEYPPRSRWDPGRGLARRFGLATDGAAPETVRLRFPAESRTYALERQWMPDQVVEERPDGGVDVVFVAEGAELAFRVLEWGGYCEVVEPASLRARVAELARAALERHLPKA